MRLTRALSTTALLGLLAAPAAAGEGPAALGVPGRAQGRAGAGLVAGDDAFALSRNPAAMARLQGDLFAVGAQGTVWRHERDDLPGVRGTSRNRAFGGPAFAWVMPLGRKRIHGWADPFDVPIRAGLAPLPPREGRGEIRIPLQAAPRAVEVRAKGANVAIRELLITTLGPKGGKPLGSSTAKGAALNEADWLRLAGWNQPTWAGAKSAGTLVIAYKFVFTDAATRNDFAIVRVDVDGQEAARRDHEPPAPKTNGGRPANGGGDAPIADLLDAPDPAILNRLERGHWRLGVAARPAAYFASAVDAPGQPSGYRMQYAVESLTVGLANEIFDGFAVGISGHVYASAILDLQMPATVPNGAGSTQTDAFDLGFSRAEGIGISAGVTWLPCPRKCLMVGLHYSSRSYLTRHTGEAEMTGLSIPLVAVNSVTGSWDASVRGLNLPQRAGFGLAWRPGAHDGNDGFFLLAADVTWWDWGQEANDIVIKLEDGDANATNATGSNTTTLRVPLNWKDRFSAAIGVSVRVLDPWLLHAGYAYGRNPAPNHSTHPLLPAVIRHHAAAGTSLKLGGFELSASVVAGLREEVTLAGAGTAGVDLTAWELGAAFSVQYGF